MLGLALWLSHATMLFSFPCEFPEEYWLKSTGAQLPLYWMFAGVFLLVFWWNVSLYVAAWTKGAAGLAATVHFGCNCVAIVIIGAILWGLYDFSHDYGVLYKPGPAKWITTDGGWIENECRRREPYLGVWVVTKRIPNDVPTMLGDEVEFVRNRSFRTSTGVEEARVGYWRPPGSWMPLWLSFSEDPMDEEYWHVAELGDLLVLEGRRYGTDGWEPTGEYLELTRQ